MLSTSKFRGGTNYIMLITLSLIVSLHYVSAMDNSVPGVGAISTPFSLQGSIETHGVVTVDTSGMNK